MLPHAASVGAQVAHESQASDASAGVATEVDDQSSAVEFSHSAADVACDIHSEHAGEHADSDVANIGIELPGAHNLGRHYYRPLLLARARDCESQAPR